ncbi:Hypothetical predicted protein [Mytilus galloprovincialis]|uniref:Uncharacterized protein n=1 Tax=Mytilus galloprovincialis TaxID=29158 RepID=A0A8B6EL90_MYTGA|nr:Hypothetical predicted protein [Mytilus galloprovincialis]
MEETPPKLKVETIVEEEQSESRVAVVNCNDTETIPVTQTQVEVKTEIKVEESPVILVEEKQTERKVDEKRDFDVVVSEQKCVSPDGSQVIPHRSERTTETIQKVVLTHTRRELKPEEIEKYKKEIEAADKKSRMGLQDELGEERKEKPEIEEPKEVKAPVESDDKKEESVIEIKVVKSENTLEENLKKIKYIDDSSGDSVSEKVKEHDKTPEVVKHVVNEEAGNENVAPKLDKKESMRLKKEEKERKKKELAEEKERKKMEIQEEKERVKRVKLEEKESKKEKEKEAEKKNKKKEKEEKKLRKIRSLR